MTAAHRARKFQPYFVAYAASLGVSPEAAFLNLRGHEFIIWIHQRWDDWDAITHAGKSPAGRSDAELESFGVWLAAGCPVETEAAQ